MKQKIRTIILGLTLVVMGGLAFAPATVSADLKNDACEGVNSLNGTNSPTCSTIAGTQLDKLIQRVIQVLSVIVGFAAVVMVIVGGLKYITANGDSGAMASARSTIIYALVGLVIVAIAQILVHFVLHKTGQAIK